MGHNVSYQKGCSFFKLNSLRMSSATSFDLDQSTILPFWKEIIQEKYCENRRNCLKQAIPSFTTVFFFFIKKVTYVLNLTHLNCYLQPL